MSVPEELIEKLLDKGSVAALARELGDDMAAQIMHELTERSPQEIRASWPMVIAWGRMQQAYEYASRRGDTDAMLKASKAQADLLKGLY